MGNWSYIPLKRSWVTLIGFSGAHPYLQLHVAQVMKTPQPLVLRATGHTLVPRLRNAWRIIPVSKWLVTPIYKPSRPFGRPRGLTNHGYKSLTNWDDPPSGRFVPLQEIQMLNLHVRFGT